MSVSDYARDARRSSERQDILTWIDIPNPPETQPAPNSASKRPVSTRAPALKSRAARENTITLPPEIPGTDPFIDWGAEAGRVASDATKQMGEKKEFRSFDRHPAGMGPPPPKSSSRQLGDSEHYEGGVIVDWINDHCYYTNQDTPIAAFGPALRLQTPVCKGGGSSRDTVQSFEEWKKEKENR